MCGKIVITKSGTISIVEPSGSLARTSSAPRRPDAPGRLSITMPRGKWFRILWPRSRATTSVPPPAGKGTTRRATLLAGSAIARFSPSRGDPMLAATAASTARRVCIGVRWLLSDGRDAETARGPLDPLEDDRDALANADAHGAQRIPPTRSL